MITGDFKLTPEFLRDIVAKHTFHNSAGAALRELIQNAHDACIVRCAVDGKNDGAVDVLLDSQEGTITVTDNGVGMTADDIQEYLTTVGRGKKGSSIAEKYKIPDSRAKLLVNVVGEFGFGFIASFIIAEKIEIYTRHFGKGAKSLKCVFSTSGIAYQIEEIETELPVGTKLVLSLNNEHRLRGLRPPKSPIEGSILSYDTVEAIIKKYCLLLEYPITVTLQGEVSGPRLNVAEFPWHQQTNLNTKVKAFYENRQGPGSLGELLLTIPFSFSKENGDEVTMEGVLVVDARGSIESEERDRFGNLEVFVKRMWVCEGQKQLLPHWAWFITGVLVTPDLRPLPGRDALESQNESFDRVKRVLHRHLTGKFLEIAQKQPKLFARIQDECGFLLRAGLVMERELADKEKREFVEGEILRYIRFWRYSKKYLQGNACTLNEYLGITPDASLNTKEKGRKVYYVPRPIPANRQREFLQMLTSQSFEVIVPQDPTESMLLVAINSTFTDVNFQSIETDLLQRYAGILQGEQRDRWSSFLKYFNTLCEGHRMKSSDIGAMQPDYMPAMVLSVADNRDDDSGGPEPKADKKSEGAEAKLADGMQATLLPHLPEQLRKIYSQTVVINTRNEAMKALLEYKEQHKLEQVDAFLADCLHECCHLATIAAMDIVPSEWMQHHVEHQCGLICQNVRSRAELLEEQERSVTLQKELDEKKGKWERELAESVRRDQDQRKAQEELAAANAKNEATLAGITGIKVEDLQRIPCIPEERFAVIVLCDLVSSTKNLLGYDFMQRGEVMHRFVDAARSRAIENGGFFDKFTGDGVMALFGTDCRASTGGIFDIGASRDACVKAWNFQRALAGEIDRLNDDEQVKLIRLRNPAVQRLQLRVAIDAGLVSFGRYGGLGTAVGIPVIRAFRLCSEREAYLKAERATLVTEQFANGYDPAPFVRVDYEFVPKGIDSKVPIYRWKDI